MKHIFYSLMLLLLLSGCQEDDATVINEQPQQQQPPEENEPNEPVAIAFEQVTKGSFPLPLFPFNEGNFVLQNSTEWTAFLTHPTTNQVVSIGVTPDFENYTYIVVRHHFHAQTNDDVDINIESVTSSNGTITVKYIKTTYDEGDIMLLISQHPYHMVRIPATTLPIVFEQI